ncbi:uncharacterized protein LOC114004759, partial [Tupaia chinensis]|uniref:uncharacterized protein LOC114004759 n=1 Tax=Tupaia chinensis TaxID=246437 RepID=UPI000FFC8F4A
MAVITVYTLCRAASLYSVPRDRSPLAPRRPLPGGQRIQSRLQNAAASGREGPATSALLEQPQPGPPRPGLQAQSPLAARRRDPPPLARPGPARREGPGRVEASGPRCGVRLRQGPRERAPRGTAAAGPARAAHLRPAELSGAENYSSRHAGNWTAEALRRGPAVPLTLAALSAARGAGTRAMEEAPPPLLGGNKPLLEKLTLGITRILESSPGVTEVTIIEKAPAA